MPYPYSDVLAPRPSVERSAVIDGVNTHWWDYPSSTGARTLVLVHGFRGDHHGLALIADALTEFRVLIPDLPGFGASSEWPTPGRTIEDFGRWLRAFRAATDTSDAMVVGHSFGTVVVANAVRDLGVAPVVLINPISRLALDGPRRLLLGVSNLWYRIAGELPGPIGNAVLSAPVVVRLMSIVLAKTTDPALRRWIHDQHAHYFSRYASLRSVVDAYAISTSTTVADYASAIPARVLLIATDLDDVTSLDAQVSVREQFPDAELVVLEGVGHLTHYERPIEVATAIRDFVAG